MFRLDGDRFPTSVRLAAETTAQGERWTLADGDRVVDLGRVRAAWFYQTWIGYALPEMRYRELARQMAVATLHGVLACLGAFLVDPFGPAEHKPVQLKVAREVGLDVPATLLTNDPDAVRRFARASGGAIVAKAPTVWLKVFDDDGTLVEKAFTSLVTEQDLADLDGLRLGPMIFQERIPKACELRVVVAGEEIFAVAIDPHESDVGGVDWRRNFDFDYERRPYAIPDDVRRRILAMMDRLGLNYASIDMIVTPDGRHVFLEANPNGGGFEALQKAGLPVAEAIAALLLGRRPRRPAGRAHAFDPG